MQFLEQEILEITETTWQAMLGLDIHLRPLPAVLNPHEDFLTGRVEISGAWNGVVLLHGSSQLTRSAAAMIFANGMLDVTSQDLMDAMYELTNIIGGNIKALLPEPSQLSLPCVHGTTPEIVAVPGAEQVSDLVFDCQGQPLFVSVWKRIDD
ncbi:MAG: chemotaxis protein CheX [Nitrospirales bacterium]